jgi:formylglycine-generating enzyme required for sulfatase activity
MWSIPPAQTVLIQKVKDGTATLADLTGGGATQLGASPGNSGCTGSEYPGTFPYDGNYTAPLYAVSIPAVLPSACISAYQSKAACEIVGKRLMTNAEWIAAAASTPDTNVDDGSTDCNTNAQGGGVNAPVNAGSRAACVSTEGTFDMIGNVYEWTEGAFGPAWFRGGSWGSGTVAGLVDAGQDVPNFQFQASDVGFRCAR